VPDDAILLLPGMTLNASVFPDLGRPTVAVDFAKLVVGPEGSSPDLEAQRMNFYVERLRERLAASSLWRQARRRVAVGHSFGGFLALAWQAQVSNDPLDRLDGLVLIATTAGPLYEAVRLRLLGGEHWAVRVPVTAFMRLWNSRWLTRTMARLLARGGKVSEVDFRLLRRRTDFAMGLAGWRNTDWRARRSYRFAMDGFDVRQALPHIGTPAIVLHGTRDTFFPVEAARDLARGLPRAELRIVRGASHSLPLTHGPEVVSAVNDVLCRPVAISGVTS
jgi:pimeloyl-ACP methyl ester carboxylesterase